MCTPFRSQGRSNRFFSLVVVGLTWSVLAATAPVSADRPSAMKLFPEETLVFVRTPNAQEFIERFKETATGRMARDPHLKPLVDQLYGDAGELYAEKAEEKLGVSWEELQQLPTGEVAFAVVEHPDREQALLLVEPGDQPNIVKKLVEKSINDLRESGIDISTEKISGVEVTVVREADTKESKFGLFEKDGTIVVATHPDVMRAVLSHWGDGDAADDSAGAGDEEASHYSGRTLAENPQFASIVRHCRRPQDPPPQLIFYADPVGFFRQAARNNAGPRVAVAMFPALGIDGLLGIGGSVTFAAGQYDDLTHVDLLLQNPRAGVLQLIAFEPGDTTPQPWVPAAIESYMTWHWNVAATYDKLIELVDRFRGEGSTEKLIADILSERLGVDFPTQVIDNLAGRFSWVVSYDKPARMNSQRSLLAAELRDEAFAAETLQTTIDRYPDLFQKRQFGDVGYWAVVPEWLKNMPEEDRPFEPCVAILDGYLFASASCQSIERLVAARDGTVERLVDSADYKLVMERLGRETTGVRPAMFSFGRFEETLRHWYDLLSSDQTRDSLEEVGKKNPLLAALAKTLAEHELPPFEVLARYVAPGGGILYDTDTGLHGFTFTLRKEE